MFVTQQDFKPPGLSEARRFQAEVRRLGIQDVEFKWDPELKNWCVVQVRKTTSGFVTMNSIRGTDVDPWLLWYCQNDENGGYRAPNQNDVNNIVATVRSNNHWWGKGSDAFTQEVEGRDVIRRQKKEERHRERVQPHVKALKRAIREELG